MSLPTDNTLDSLNGDSLETRMLQYQNVAACNGDLYREFIRRTDCIPFLKEHRDWVEGNKWGFGSRSFHYLWLLIIDYVLRLFNGTGKALEIGVYKGQVISLWALCARHLHGKLDIHAISPFEGNLPRSLLARMLKVRLSPTLRRLRRVGSLYAQDDYLRACNEIHERFGLSFADVNVVQSDSTAPAAINAVKDKLFEVIYIDGDHSFESVLSDIRTFAPLLKKGGLLVMDDAGCNLPGDGYWKGISSVSEACEIIPAMGFRNVLNISHNRVYIRE